MPINCGQTVIPTTDETPLPCEQFSADRCIVHEAAIAYLSLAAETPLDVVLDTYLLSLIDARNRIQILEEQPAKVTRVNTTTAITLVAADAENRVSSDNILAVALTVPDDITLNFAIGTEITILNLGVGVVTIGGVGITFIQETGLTINQGGGRTLIKVAANTWVIKY